MITIEYRGRVISVDDVAYEPKTGELHYDLYDVSEQNVKNTKNYVTDDEVYTYVDKKFGAHLIDEWYKDYTFVD